MFKNYLMKQFELHRSFEPQDLVKLCYQAAFGAKHILSNKEQAYNYLIYEFNNCEFSNEPLYEEISDDVVRVNIATWKNNNYSVDDLFKIFVNSATICNNGIEKFYMYIEETKNFLSLYGYDDLLYSLIQYLESYFAIGITSVHHSDEYRTYNHPSYRIVKKELLLKYLNTK